MSEKLPYEQALHGIQTGIALEIERGSDCASPKHLRVGVNSAMCEHAALVRMLIAKGIITEEEYAQAITDEFNRELERVEKNVNEHYGGNGKIKLR
jgi:hypothetical protein